MARSLGKLAVTLAAVAGAACAPAPVGRGEFESWPVVAEAPPPGEQPLPAVWGVPALEDLNPDPNIVEVNLRAVPNTLGISDTRQVRGMYTFNGLYPGPLLQAKQGDRIVVHFKNDLPEPTTIHWHGLRIPADMDGSPRIQSPVQPGGEFTYSFVAPDPGSFWYHPHVRANEQVEKGLYAPIVIHDAQGQDPVFDLERYLLLDDMLLAGGDFEPFLQSGMEAMHGRFGNVLVTNGRVEGKGLGPKARRGQVERWRLVNTSNARTMVVSVSGARIFVVGTDGGWLAQPYAVSELTIAVGQRYDLMVAYDTDGEVALYSHVEVLDANNNVVVRKIPVLSVAVASGPAPVLPVVAPRPADERAPNKQAEIVIDAVNDPTHGLMWRLNGKSHAMDPMFTFAQGDTVKMTITNTAGPEHPFHLHGQFFTISGGAEPGLKDVVLVGGQETREIVARFDNPGRWMAHCHILEHAEVGMMAEIEVTPRQQ